MYLGLDVSTIKTGVAVLNEKEEILYNEVIKLNPEDALTKRAEIVEEELEKIWKLFPTISKVFVEEPIILFKGGSSAKTVAKLQCFNGMICYVVYRVFRGNPIMINAVSARSVLGIKILKKRGTKQRDRKQPIIDFIENKYHSSNTPFIYEKTKGGSYKPGTDDKCDAIVIALAGSILKKESVDKV